MTKVVPLLKYLATPTFVPFLYLWHPYRDKKRPSTKAWQCASPTLTQDPFPVPTSIFLPNCGDVSSGPAHKLTSQQQMEKLSSLATITWKKLFSSALSVTMCHTADRHMPAYMHLCRFHIKQNPYKLLFLNRLDVCHGLSHSARFP